MPESPEATERRAAKPGPVVVSECFACHPTPAIADRIRALCMTHKTQVRMEAGELLSELLARATPPDHPLEGSTLGWIFCPVYVEVDGRRIKGWPDFAGGGMAVLEDCFGVRGSFELKLVLDPRFRPLLRAVASTKGPRPIDRIWSATWGLGDGAPELDWTHFWTLQRAFDHLRRTERRWPASFDDLQRWLELSREQEPSDVSDSMDAIIELADRLAVEYPDVLGRG